MMDIIARLNDKDNNMVELYALNKPHLIAVIHVDMMPNDVVGLLDEGDVLLTLDLK